MKPMLAVDHDPNKLEFPYYASPKLDGLRGLVKDGQLLSRSLKLIPNIHVQNTLAKLKLNGMDGELIAGQPTAKNCMQACTSFFMAPNKVSDDWRLHVFDMHDSEMGYDVRHQALTKRLLSVHSPHVVLHERRVIKDHDDLLAYEAESLNAGYEGLILRRPHSLYKFGRSTVNEGFLLKVKRFTDGEAIILGFEEQMENTNEKQTNELGRSKRSSHKAGLVGKGTLGALLVRDVVSGVEFSVGTGLNDGMRDHIWSTRDDHEGKIVKYKSFLIGVKDAPRHPVFLGFRDKRDMS